MRPALIALRISGILVCVAVILLSLMPAPPLPLAFSLSDKIEHALSYTLMSFLLCLGFLSSKAAPGRVLALILSMILLGAGIETVQPAFGRSFEWLDMGSNAGGVLAGWLVSLLIVKIRRRARKEA